MTTVLLTSPSFDWLISVAVAFYVLSTTGRKQRAEGNGTWLRLFTVAFALAVIVSLPMAANAVLCAFRGPDPGLFVPAVALSGISLFTSLRMVAPIRLRGVRSELPSLDDHEIVSRIASLAQKMNVASPRVRIVRAMDKMFAGVGGLQAPSIVVFQGITNRLNTEERDAVFGHELAHLANHSLWCFAATMPAAGCLTLIAKSWLPALPATPFGLCLGFGLYYIVSRRFEIDCDYRAARATSFHAMQSSLAKLHADQNQGNQSLLAMLTYSMITHPHRDVRLAKLYWAAPEHEASRMAKPATTVSRHRLFSIFSLIIWLAVLVYGLLAGKFIESPRVPSEFILLAVVMTPSFLLACLHSRLTSHERLRRRKRGNPVIRWVVLIGGLSLAFFLITVVSVALVLSPLSDYAEFLTLAGIVVAAVIFLFLRIRRQKVRSKMLAAVFAHQFTRIIEVADDNKNAIAKSHELRQLVALARAVTGDRERALSELQQLVDEKTRYPLIRWSLGALLIDENRCKESLLVFREIAERLPKDPLPWVEMARGHRRLGHLQEAERAIDHAFKLEPTNGLAEAMRAAIALDQNDFSGAEHWLSLANEHAPGMALVRVVAAEFALATQSEELAKPEVEAAIRSLESEPLTLMTTELTWLRSVLRRPLVPTATDESLLPES